MSEYILVTVEGFEDNEWETHVTKIEAQNDQCAYRKLYANFINSILKNEEDFPFTESGLKICESFLFNKFFKENMFTNIDNDYTWVDNNSIKNINDLIIVSDFDDNYYEHGRRLSIGLKYKNTFDNLSNVYRLTHSIHKFY